MAQETRPSEIGTELGKRLYKALTVTGEELFQLLLDIPLNNRWWLADEFSKINKTVWG